MGSTNGETPNVWANITLTPPPLAWNTRSPSYGKTDYTGISQLNSWYVCQVPVTALTGRHGYTRGHGMISGTAITNNPMAPAMSVYFCGPYNNNLVTVNVLADITRNDGVNDYTVLLFDTNVTTSGMTPMQVSSEPQGQTVQLATQQAWYGGDAGTVALVSPLGPFVCTPLGPLLPRYLTPGDSGSPVMVLTDDNPPALVFTGGTGATSWPGSPGNSPIQADIDTLIGIANTYYGQNLRPSNYQMQWDQQ